MEVTHPESMDTPVKQKVGTNVLIYFLKKSAAGGEFYTASNRAEREVGNN